MFSSIDITYKGMMKTRSLTKVSREFGVITHLSETCYDLQRTGIVLSIMPKPTRNSSYLDGTTLE
jgi:hypothetical protein